MQEADGNDLTAAGATRLPLVSLKICCPPPLGPMPSEPTET